MLHSWVLVLKLSKKYISCNFVLTSARSISLLKQFTYMLVEVLITHFQKLMLFLMLWLTVSQILVFKVEEFLRNFCWVSIFFDISIANISWTVDQTPINHSIFWKSVMRTFRCIYEIASRDLDFLLSSAQNYKKCTFLDNLQTITQIGNMETRQMTPIFSSTFSTQTICNIFFIWK